VSYLSALEVCSRRGAIQIHVYLYPTLPYLFRTMSFLYAALSLVGFHRSVRDDVIPEDGRQVTEVQSAGGSTMMVDVSLSATLPPVSGDPTSNWDFVISTTDAWRWPTPAYGCRNIPALILGSLVVDEKLSQIFSFLNYVFLDLPICTNF